MSMRIVVYSDEQETQEIVVLDGKEEIFSSSQNHDIDGWQGMETARDIAKGIAHALHVPFKQEYKEFD